MASSSSSPPSWVILSRVPLTSDDGPPGFEYALKPDPAPSVSLLTIAPRIFPQPIMLRDSQNPSILAVEPAGGGLLLLHANLRRAGPSNPIVKTVVSRQFVASYIVLDRAHGSTIAIPNPGLLIEPAKVGILYSPSGEGSYVVAEIQLVDGKDAILVRFTSHDGEWIRTPVHYPSALVESRPFGQDGVLSLNGKLWWIDISRGLLTCDPFANSPRLSFITLPPDNVLQSREPQLQKFRLISISAGKLRFVDMYHRRGARRVSVWTLQAARDSTSTPPEWVLDNDVTFQSIWGHQTYRDTKLPKKIPALSLLHPQNPHIVYFFLEGYLFSVDLQSCKVVNHIIYDPVPLSNDEVSSRSFHALELQDTFARRACPVDSKAEGDTEELECGKSYVRRRFLASYDQQYQLKMRKHGDQNARNAVSYNGVRGQTAECVSEALNSYNLTNGTDFEVDNMMPRDSNAFEVPESGRFRIHPCYFHINFSATNSRGVKQFFFAELHGIDGPDNVSVVKTLGHEKTAIQESSAEHICIYCTGIMHPNSGPFVGKLTDQAIINSGS